MRPSTYILNSYGYEFEIASSWCHTCQQHSLKFKSVNKSATKMTLQCSNDPSHVETRKIISMKRFEGKNLAT